MNGISKNFEIKVGSYTIQVEGVYYPARIRHDVDKEGDERIPESFQIDNYTLITREAATNVRDATISIKKTFPVRDFLYEIQSNQVKTINDIDKYIENECLKLC